MPRANLGHRGTFSCCGCNINRPCLPLHPITKNTRLPCLNFSNSQQQNCRFRSVRHKNGRLTIRPRQSSDLTICPASLPPFLPPSRVLRELLLEQSNHPKRQAPEAHKQQKTASAAFSLPPRCNQHFYTMPQPYSSPVLSASLYTMLHQHQRQHQQRPPRLPTTCAAIPPLRPASTPAQLPTARSGTGIDAHPYFQFHVSHQLHTCQPPYTETFPTLTSTNASTMPATVPAAYAAHPCAASTQRLRSCLQPIAIQQRCRCRQKCRWK